MGCYRMKKIQLFHKILFTCAWSLILPFTSWADTGNYYGTATISTPANLGTIDLAFNLDVNGTIIQHDTSYIMLDKTLLFPAVPPQVVLKDVGPRIKTGNLTPSAFDLTTDDFTSVVSGRTVTRKVVLVGTSVTNGGNSLSGNYTETITGLTPQPVVVIGTFILVRPTVQTIVVALKDPNGDGCIDLNEIRSAGAYENSIEFGDISQALHLHNNPQTNLNVCTKPNDLSGQQTIKDALAEYYATQKQ